MATFDVLLPVKNGVTYLAEALDSICHQSFRDWRIIVLDHGSSDGGLELAHRYAEADSRIVVRVFPDAQGLSGLLNCGLQLCDCQYILRQDADDVSLPQRMEVLADAFDADRKLALVGSLGDVINAQGIKIGSFDLPTGPNGIAAAALFRNPIAHPTVAMRLESLRRMNATYGEDFIGAVPENRRLRVSGLAEDYFLFGQLAFIARCINLDRSLIKYRWHGGNVATTKYVDQMRTALSISRYLAESLSIVHGVSYVDPAPFCNHSDALFDMGGRKNFSSEHESISEMLIRAVPDTPELSRELAFRKVVSVRGYVHLTARYCAFVLQHSVRQSELRTVKSWLLRKLKKLPTPTVTAAGLPH